MTLILLIFRVSFVLKTKVFSQLIQQITQNIAVLSKDNVNHIFINIQQTKELKNHLVLCTKNPNERLATIISTKSPL